MPFNTALFVCFFLLFFVVYWFVLARREHRLGFIIVSGCVFYGWWNWHFVPLLLGTGVIDFLLARAIGQTPDARRKKQLLILSVAMNLGVLGVFKYTNFLLGTVASVWSAFGTAHHFPTLSIILPVGISFYTFQSISYTVDVYRGVFGARKRLGEFLAALTFFPHLVAGPIVRSSFLLPQFDTIRAPDAAMVRRGLWLIAAGLLKKTIADRLGAVADPLFELEGPVSALEGWTAALAFSGQVYGDFSGYSDLAVGLAALLGVVLPANFELPTLASSPAEFWRRWHISLSTWLRDYLWLPLSIAWARNPLRNLIITFVLGGLWHGANWTFVAWGLYHGVLLALGQWYSLRARPGAASPAPKPSGLRRFAQVAFTFYLMTLGWVLFRATSLGAAAALLRGMHLPERASEFAWAPVVLLALTVAGNALLTAIDQLTASKATAWSARWPLWPWVVTGMGLAFAFGGNERPFIYFQF